jgi:ribosome-associated protein
MTTGPQPPEIPERELQFTFVRGAGPGGQNVNKVASAAQLRFDLAGSTVLNERVKARLRAAAGQRLTADGAIQIMARNHRSQEGNRREALMRLAALIEAAWREPKLRRATRPTRASQLRRVEGKVQHKRQKQLRGRVRLDD